jgi:hypothetical protein
MLYDWVAHVAIPAQPEPGSLVPTDDTVARSYPPGSTPPTPAPTPIFQIRLASKPDCGDLGIGRHPCLVAESPTLVIS